MRDRKSTWALLLGGLSLFLCLLAWLGPLILEQTVHLPLLGWDPINLHLSVSILLGAVAVGFGYFVWASNPGGGPGLRRKAALGIFLAVLGVTSGVGVGVLYPATLHSGGVAADRYDPIGDTLREIALRSHGVYRAVAWLEKAAREDDLGGYLERRGFVKGVERTAADAGRLTRFSELREIERSYIRCQAAEETCEKIREIARQDRLRKVLPQAERLRIELGSLRDAIQLYASIRY